MRTSFAAHVHAQLKAYGDARCYTFVRDDSGAGVDLRRTYTELDAAARGIAARLVAMKQPVQPVLLVYPDGVDFLEAFLGCLYAGVIAVPAPFPHRPLDLDRIIGIVADAGIRHALTTTALAPGLARRFAEAGLAGRVTCVGTDAGPTDASAPEAADGWRMPRLGPDSVAFLQYTSGSTREPRGVVVTHANLLHNAAEIERTVGGDDSDTSVGWLPHSHDMGLIGMLLQPLYVGAAYVCLTPMTFLKRPIRWLEAVGRYGGTVTAAPNFAYDLCARTITDDQVAGLDLSSLRVAFNGAEPIRAATLSAFTRRFGPAGFRAEAFSPCYGLAESTLIVTGSRIGDRPVSCVVSRQPLERGDVRTTGSGGLRLVGSGRPGSLDVRVVDPGSREVLPASRVGEIWVRGDSVAAGYWNQPEATAETFGAHTASGDGPYLRTGDLGFLLDGELFVTGRMKDMLILNGRNLYPQDLELAVRDLHVALGGGFGAAFPADADGAHLVVVHEVKPAQLGGTTLAELATRIRGSLASSFGVSAPSVVLTRPGGVRRTTSGKVQRQLMRELFLADHVASLHDDVEPAVAAMRRPAGAYDPTLTGA